MSMYSYLQFTQKWQDAQKEPGKSLEPANRYAYMVSQMTNTHLVQMAMRVSQLPGDVLETLVDMEYASWFGLEIPAEDKAMSDKPKPWPYDAADARDRAAENLAEALALLEHLCDSMSRLEDATRYNRAMNALNRSIRLLESVGARTRP